MAGNCISKSKRVVFEETLPEKAFRVRREENSLQRSCRKKSGEKPFKMICGRTSNACTNYCVYKG